MRISYYPLKLNYFCAFAFPKVINWKQNVRSNIVLLFFIWSSVVNCRQRASICEGREFIERPAQYKCPIENTKLKLTTKSQIETRLPEPLLMLAHSRCYKVQLCFCKYFCWWQCLFIHLPFNIFCIHIN